MGGGGNVLRNTNSKACKPGEAMSAHRGTKSSKDNCRSRGHFEVKAGWLLDSNLLLSCGEVNPALLWICCTWRRHPACRKTRYRGRAPQRRVGPPGRSNRNRGHQCRVPSSRDERARSELEPRPPDWKGKSQMHRQSKNFSKSRTQQKTRCAGLWR